MENLSEKEIGKIESQLSKTKEFTLFTSSKEKEYLIEFYINTQYLMILAIEKENNYIF